MLPRMLLRGKTARLILTFGGPAWLHGLLLGGTAYVAMQRSVLLFCGVWLNGWTCFGGLHGAVAPEKVRAMERSVERLGAGTR